MLLMTCNPDTYTHAWHCVADGFRWLVTKLNGYLGGEQLAILVIIVAMVPLVVLFLYVAKNVVPVIAGWYYDETIRQKARHYWRTKCVGLGFKQSTAVTSIAAGVVFYFLVRISAAVPLEYIVYTLSGLMIAFSGISVLGYFVSGRVPPGDRARQRYWKRFQIPTITGLALGIGTIAADFIINGVSILVGWL